MQARAAGNLEPFDASVNELRNYFTLLQGKSREGAKKRRKREGGKKK
jgi:hypothetical protein